MGELVVVALVVKEEALVEEGVEIVGVEEGVGEEIPVDEMLLQRNLMQNWMHITTR